MRGSQSGDKDILSDEQLEKFDGVFDNAIGKTFRGVMMKEKD